MRSLKKYILIVLGTSVLYSVSATAGISLDGTRIIFREENEKIGTNIQVRSAVTSETPYLVKTQITQDTTGQNNTVPFITTPALFRLEPGNANQVRILSKPHNLAKDRESIFYFRATAVPATHLPEQDDNYKLGGELQLASGNVIKLFYRPKGLSISFDQAAAELVLSATPQGIKVSNPTPYYLTLSSIMVQGKAVNIRTTPGRNMIAPFSDVVFPHQGTSGTVQWQIINDYGGIETSHGKIQ